MIDAYIADTDRLGLGRPDYEPRASETIAEIIELIEELIEGGHAYAVDGDVYFSVRTYPRYGEISHRNLDDMDQGEGMEGAERKRDPADFALWKAREARRGHRVGCAVGAGTAGMAHRVLGDGRGAARPRVRRSTAAART